MIKMIPIYKLNSKEGSITFGLNVGNLYDKTITELIISEDSLGNSTFKLYRNSKFELVFEYNNMSSKVQMEDFIKCNYLWIALTWNPSQIKLYVGDKRNNIKKGI